VPKHIVIVEHDPDILENMRRLLEAEGHIVTGYSFFPSIVELAFMRADCFIIEEWLPRVSGHAICLMLKAKILTSAIPIVLVSTTDLFEPVTNMCQADAVLGKQFNDEDLVRVVSSVMISCVT
jgi:DNA-binding response OmpR family regulator